MNKNCINEDVWELHKVAILCTVTDVLNCIVRTNLYIADWLLSLPNIDIFIIIFITNFLCNGVP